MLLAFQEEHSCYLFDCGSPSKCVFAHHGNYTVMSFQNQDYQPHSHQKYHENELESLGKTPSPVPATTTLKSTPTPVPVRVNGTTSDITQFIFIILYI